MTTPARKLAGRLAVAILLVMLAAGSVFAAAATLPSAQPRNLAEPTEKASPEAKESPDTDKDKATDEDADESPGAAEAPEAQEAPDTDTSESPGAAPSPENLARIVTLLGAAGITTTADELAALAAKVGVGGAVRVLRFAQASGKSPTEILALFESGKGWGVIARELNLDIGPGNGSVMGKGHGQDAAAKAADRAARAAAKAARAAARAARGAGSGD